MSKAFDPYQAWLGIPPSRRPPSPCEILGVEEGETEYERIREATAERYDQVRNLVLGPQREHALRLLDDISQAFVSLTEGGRQDTAEAKPSPPLPPLPDVDAPPKWPVVPPPLDIRPLDAISPRRKRRPRSIAVVLLAPVVWVDKRLESIAGRENTILHRFLRCVAVVVLLLLPPGLARLVSSLKQQPTNIVTAAALDPEDKALESRDSEGKGSEGEDPEEPATDDPNGMGPEAMGTEPAARSGSVEPRLPLSDDQELVVRHAGTSGSRSGARPGIDGASRIQLRLRLEEGETYRVRMTEKIALLLLPEVSKQETTLTRVFGLSYLVREIRDDGTAEVQVTYDSVQVRQGEATGRAEFDSSDPAPAESLDPAVRPFATLVGASFRIDVTPMGQVTKVAGADELASRILGDVGSREAVEEQAKQEYGDQAMKEVMEEMLGAFPAEPVGIGDSWSKRSVATRGFGGIVTNTWTLKSRREGVAVLDLQSTVQPDPDAQAMDLEGTKLKYELRGTRSGSVEIDEATGWVLRSMVRQSVSGELKLEGGPQSAENMALPVSIERVTRVERR